MYELQKVGPCAVQFHWHCALPFALRRAHAQRGVSHPTTGRDPISDTRLHLWFLGRVGSPCGGIRTPNFYAHLFIHNTPTRKRSHQSQDIHNLAHITPASFKCSQTCDAYRAHRHGSESPLIHTTRGVARCSDPAWPRTPVLKSTPLLANERERERPPRSTRLSGEVVARVQTRG